MQLVLGGRSQATTQCTCLLDVGLHVQQHARSYARGGVQPTSLVHHPLLASEAVLGELGKVLPSLPRCLAREAAGVCQQCMGDTATPMDVDPQPSAPGPLSDSHRELLRLTYVHAANLIRNPLVQNYVTVAERQDTHVSATVLSSAICSSAEAAAQARGPLAQQQARSMAERIGVLVHEGEATRPQRHALFVHAGLTPRPGSMAAARAQALQRAIRSPNQPAKGAAEQDDGAISDPEAWSMPDEDPYTCSDSDEDEGPSPATPCMSHPSPPTTPAAAPATAQATPPSPLLTKADGTPIAGGGPMDISVEAGLFPMIFTWGKGWYKWARHSCLTNYLRMRMLMPFSFFTLYLPFLLLMFVVHQQHMLAACLVDQVLQRDVARERRRNPHATDSEVVSSLLRNRIPATLTGSPSYFRNNLADLQCMVDKYKLPHLFMTLTADEVSSTRWPEMVDLDQCLDK
jgi:Helitron helicase-like domain at N-terminus